jgi:hypothetical protein
VSFPADDERHDLRNAAGPCDRTCALASFPTRRQDLDALLRQRQGELRDEPYRLLLVAIAAREKSGVLTLRRGPLEKVIVFDSGAAVDCHSNIATESLGRFLVATGRIDESQYHDALAVAASRGIALEELLVERTILTPVELTRASQQNLGRKLLEPFHWTRGTWHMSYDMPRMEVVHRVRVPQLVVTGVMKVEPFETIEGALSEAGPLPLSVNASPLFDLSDLRLSEEQQRVLTRIRDGATLDQLRGPASSEELDRFVFALLFLGVAVPREQAVRPPLALDVAQPAPAAPPPPPGPALLPVASRDELAAAIASKDPFDLLNIDPAAGAVEITRAFLRAAEQFLPARYDERIRDQAQEVFLASVRAYGELADPVRRQAVIDKRAPRSQTEETHPTPPPDLTPSKPRRAIIDPEELYRQGRAASTAGKLREALGYFEMAADCDVQNGTYSAEAAYCRYQLLISPANVTVKALKNAIRIDPKCAVAHLYLGKIQESLGNHVEAQAYLGRASMLKNRSRF